MNYSVCAAVVVALMIVQTSVWAATTPKQCVTAKCKKGCEPGLGSDGCRSRCVCPQKCKDLRPRCTKDEVCEYQTVFCFIDPCFPIPRCVPKPTCPPLSDACLTMKCAYGMRKDKDGCTLCQCLTEPPQCPPSDPCNIRCSTGLKTDKNGCQLCECL